MKTHLNNILKRLGAESWLGEGKDEISHKENAVDDMKKEEENSHYNCLAHIIINRIN